MSRLLLIRHGQASLMRSDYDQLSEHGEAQSRALGAYLAREGVQPTQVVVGPLKRHRQTLEAAAEAALEAGAEAWPEASVEEGFREYPAFKLVAASLPLLQQRDPEFAAEVASLSQGERDPRRFRQIFQRISQGWAQSGEEIEGVGSWPGFRARVGAAMDALQERAERSGTVLVFTSGGPVAAGVGHVLGLDARRTMELTWVLENTAVSEFLFSASRISVHSFNAMPHLSANERTMV